MSDGMNKVLLLGNLGNDPELRQTSGGQPVLTFNLATSESYLDREGTRQQRTEWHRAVVWGKRAEALHRLLKKGSCVLVEGGLRTRSYEKEGQKRYITEINVRELCFASSRPSAPPPPIGEEEAKPSLIEPKAEWGPGPGRSRTRPRAAEQPGLALSA
jgi:single-strand DNA-binding protein